MFNTKAELETAVNAWVNDKANALSTYGDINTWDVSAITDMSNLFQNHPNFNEDIGNWDVSSVTNMRAIFSGAENFNQDIGRWNISNISDMSNMLDETISFSKKKL